tara:strand:+ start:182 stop:445 length:264 start_codon:yes stop_codon:yes gene_type:complete
MKDLLKKLKIFINNPIFWLVFFPFLVILVAVIPELFIAFLIIGVAILFAKNFTSQSSNRFKPSIGKRGGRFELRYSKKTGKPYRHYF